MESLLSAESSTKNQWSLIVSKYELHLGDCLEVMKSIPDGSVDLVLCDLPYGTTRNKWDSVLPLDALWTEYKRVCRGAVVLTASQPFTSLLIQSNPRDFKYCWVWEKSRFANQMLAKVQPLKIHEDIVVFSKGKAPYLPQGLIQINKTTKQGTRVTDNNGGRNPQSIVCSDAYELSQIYFAVRF